MSITLQENDQWEIGIIWIMHLSINQSIIAVKEPKSG